MNGEYYIQPVFTSGIELDVIEIIIYQKMGHRQLMGALLISMKYYAQFLKFKTHT
jgi:hypothetical protein